MTMAYIHNAAFGIVCFDDRAIKLSNDSVSCLDYEVLKEMGCGHFQDGCGVWAEGTILLNTSILSDAGKIK